MTGEDFFTTASLEGGREDRELEGSGINGAPAKGCCSLTLSASLTLRSIATGCEKLSYNRSWWSLEEPGSAGLRGEPFPLVTILGYKNYLSLRFRESLNMYLKNKRSCL
jgi:hypothetical protein